MRLPRGLQQGGVPVARGTLQSDAAGLSVLARQVSDFTDSIIEEQAQAEFADAISSAEAATRDFLNQSKQIRVNEDTGRPTFETAEEDFDQFYADLERTAVDGLSTNRAKDQVQRQLRAMREDAQVDVRAIARSHRIDDIRARTSTAVDNYLQNGDYDAARLAVSNQKAHFAPAQFERINGLIDSAESGEIHETQVNEFMAAHAASMQAGTSAEFIREFKATSPFDDDETRKIASRMHSQNNQFQAEQAELDQEFKTAAARSLQARLFVLDSRVDAGDPSAIEDIKQLVANGHISAAQGTAKRRKLDQALEINREITDGYAILSAGGILDPNNKAHRKLVNNELASIVEEVGGIETPESRTTITRLIKQTNIVPDPVKQIATTARIAGSVEQVVATADVVARISESAPIQYGQFSDDNRAFYGMVGAMVRANMDPTLAVEAVREQFSKPEPDRRVAEERYREAIRGNPNLDAATEWAKDEFDTFFSSAPSDEGIPDALISDYDTLTKVFYNKTQDIEVSRALAQQKLQSVWGRSEINGTPEVMRFAPELIHGDWVAEQVADEMSAVGVSPGVWELVSDPITARTGGTSYGIMRRTEVGIEPILIPDADGNLRIARYTPDFASSKAAQKQDERRKRFVARANKDRKRILVQQAASEQQRADALSGDPIAASNEFGAD